MRWRRSRHGAEAAAHPPSVRFDSSIGEMEWLERIAAKHRIRFCDGDCPGRDLGLRCPSDAKMTQRGANTARDLVRDATDRGGSSRKGLERRRPGGSRRNGREDTRCEASRGLGCRARRIVVADSRGTPPTMPAGVLHRAVRGLAATSPGSHGASPVAAGWRAGNARHRPHGIEVTWRADEPASGGGT
jgi:hypothetical protein